MIEVRRTYRFCSSHRLARDDWDAEKNREAFGSASEAPGHGHNYRITVVLTGEIDMETGRLADLDALDTLVEREVLDVYDHRNINVDVPSMAGKVPSTENVAIDCWRRLSPSLGSLAEIHVLMDEFFTAIYRGP